MLACRFSHAAIDIGATAFASLARRPFTKVLVGLIRSTADYGSGNGCIATAFLMNYAARALGMDGS